MKFRPKYSRPGVFNVAPAKVVLQIKRGDEIWRLSSVDFFILLTVKILLFSNNKVFFKLYKILDIKKIFLFILSLVCYYFKDNKNTLYDHTDSFHNFARFTYKSFPPKVNELLKFQFTKFNLFKYFQFANLKT